MAAMASAVSQRPRVEAIVPAHNEEKTVLNTVVPLLRSRQFDRVTVVDDGSKDRTGQLARSAGAVVRRMEKNVGKGRAMKTEVDAALARGADIICFFDSDLIGLTEQHAEKLVRPVVERAAVMCCGLRDYSPVANLLQAGLPPITGERAVSAAVIRRVPEHFWNGYRIEMGLNRAAELTGTTLLTVLRGLTIVNKTQKVGPQEGMLRHAKMFVEVLEAMRDSVERIR